MSGLRGRMDHLGLMDSTQELYLRIFAQMDPSDPVGWLRRAMKGKALGTVLPMHAVAKHVLVSEHGYDEDTAERMLPRTTGAKEGKRTGLSPTQQTAFIAALPRVSDPIRTILTLLPLTGLRVSEICALRRSNLQTDTGRVRLVFRGKKNRERIVPLNAKATGALRAYIASEQPPAPWLFPGRNGPITPGAVRKITRRLGHEHAGLRGLSPHVLRHTYATNLVRADVDLRRVQELLGHVNIATTARYVGPTVEDLDAAVDRLE